MGYRRAGVEVVGVDIEPQPRYPFEFYQEDALTVLEFMATAGREIAHSTWSAIHASPPCQAFIRSGMFDRTRYADLLTPSRAFLNEIGLPYVIENVPGAPMRPDLVLCGTMFGLPHHLRRHRWFEANWPLSPFTLACNHDGDAVGVYGHPRGRKPEGANASSFRWRYGHGDIHQWREAMGIGWMKERELGQAIPPAYTEWIGRQLVAYLTERPVVAATA